MTSVKQVQVTFDCADPERVARFWCEVLGYVVPPPPDGFADWDEFNQSLPPEDRGSAFACMDPNGVGPRLFFQRVPEGRPSRIGSTSTCAPDSDSSARNAWRRWNRSVHDCFRWGRPGCG